MTADGRAIPLAEIDPFTFLATFNRQITDERRQANWEFLKRKSEICRIVDLIGKSVLDNV